MICYRSIGFYLFLSHCLLLLSQFVKSTLLIIKFVQQPFTSLEDVFHIYFPSSCHKMLTSGSEHIVKDSTFKCDTPAIKISRPPNSALPHETERVY